MLLMTVIYTYLRSEQLPFLSCGDRTKKEGFEEVFEAF